MNCRYEYEYASDSDIRELYELQLVSFESEAEMIGSRNVPALMESFEDFEDDFPNWTVLIQRNENGRIISAARYRKFNDFYEVGRLMVHPEYRNRGLAYSLMLEIEKESGGKAFELYTCTKSYININLYTKLGYKPYKEEKGEKDLSFVYMRKEEE